MTGRWLVLAVTEAGCDATAGWYPECPATPTCSLHSCATDDIDDGAACCIAAEGMGLDDDAAADLARGCDPDAMSCDPEDYIEAAAVCAAQVAGLGIGAGSCSGSLQVHATDGQVGWLVQNAHAPDCSTGDCLEVDAVTGSADTGSACAWAN